MFSWNRLGWSGLGWLPVLSVLQDRRDRAVGAGAQRQRPCTGAIQPLGAVALRQPEDADAGAEPLLGMRARAQDDLDQRRGVVADRGGLALDPLMRPVAVAPVRARHVIGDRGRPMRAQAAQMGGHQLAAVEDLHRLRRDARLHLLRAAAGTAPSRNAWRSRRGSRG